MQINSIKKGLVLTRNYLIKQSPILLTIAAVGGVVTTTILAIRATTKAEKLIEKKKVEENVSIDEHLTIEETVKTVWKEYIPPVVSAGLTIAAIIGSSAINEKRKAALAGLYALSETALSEYQGKTKDLLGEKKEAEIRDLVNGDRAKDEVVPPNHVEMLSSGKCWVKDVMSGQKFWSSVQDICRARDEINDGIISGDMCASLNDFYEAIAADGLESVELGCEVGWKIGHLCKPYFTSTLTSGGIPILVLDWDPKGRPEADYRDI